MPVLGSSNSAANKDMISVPSEFLTQGFCVPLTTEKWGYKGQNRGTKQKN